MGGEKCQVPLTFSGIVLENSLLYIKRFLHFKSIVMSVKNILIGTLAGLAAGVALGVLVAPAEGSETRQRIADTADSFKRKLQRLRGMTLDELDELKELFEKEAEGLREDVRARALELIKAAKAKGNHVKEQAMS